LTSISQFSVELLGRTYGGGVLKIEPTAASNILVYPGNEKRFPGILEKKLNKFLFRGKRREAMRLADEWIMSNLKISSEDMDYIIRSYRYLRDVRLGNNPEIEQGDVQKVQG